jgi:hypothetical protein
LNASSDGALAASTATAVIAARGGESAESLFKGVRSRREARDAINRPRPPC